MYFNCEPIDLTQVLETIQVEKGWDYLSIFLEASATFDKCVDLIASGGRYEPVDILNSDALILSPQRPKSVYYHGYPNEKIAQWNKERALAFLHTGDYSVSMIEAIKNPYFGSGYDNGIHGDVRIFADEKRVFLVTNDEIAEEDLEDLKSLGMPIENLKLKEKKNSIVVQGPEPIDWSKFKRLNK